MARVLLYLIVVGDDTDSDAAFVCSDNCIRDLIICNGEDTDIQRFLSSVQCLDQLVEVFLGGEECRTNKDIAAFLTFTIFRRDDRLEPGDLV